MPELALGEKRSSAALAAELEKEGFKITWGIGGEATAFDRLAGLYWSRVFNRFFHRLGDRQGSEDLTQDVFLRLYRYRDRYRPRARFAGGEELDPGPARAAHEVALRGQEPTDLHRTLDRRFLGRAIGHPNAQEVEDPRHRGVVEELVADGPVATYALSAASEAQQRQA